MDFGHSGAVNTNPTAALPLPHIFAGNQRSSTAGKGIQHHIARIAGRGDDALHQLNGLLRRPAGMFPPARAGHIRPDILYLDALVRVKVFLVLKRRSRRRLHQQIVLVQLRHTFRRKPPGAGDAPKFIRTVAAGFIGAGQSAVLPPVVKLVVCRLDICVGIGLILDVILGGL